MFIIPTYYYSNDIYNFFDRQVNEWTDRQHLTVFNTTYKTQNLNNYISLIIHKIFIKYKTRTKSLSNLKLKRFSASLT